jgi:hypothetical protein
MTSYAIQCHLVSAPVPKAGACSNCCSFPRPLVADDCLRARRPACGAEVSYELCQKMSTPAVVALLSWVPAVIEWPSLRPGRCHPALRPSACCAANAAAASRTCEGSEPQPPPVLRLLAGKENASRVGGTGGEMDSDVL